MSKRRKRQRAEDYVVAPARAQKKPPTHPVMPSRCRNPLTGEPLEHGTLRIVLRDYDARRPTHQRNNIPQKLHTPEVEGLLGGHCFSPPLQRYFRHTQPKSEETKRYHWFHWWAAPGAEMELRIHFPFDAVNAVLSIRRDGADWHQTATLYNHTITWIDRMERRMQDHMQRILPKPARLFVA